MNWRSAPLSEWSPLRLNFVTFALPAWIVALLLYTVPGLIKQGSTKDWPLTHGTVLESETYRITPIFGRLRLRFRYSYEVGQEHFESTRIAWSGMALPFWSMKSFAEAHPPGSDIDVSYNPLARSESVVLQGSQLWQISTTCIVLTIFAGLTARVWLEYLKRRTRNVADGASPTRSELGVTRGRP